jgi:fucose 4-O-acetylase-like acetyltransferase
MQTDDDFQPPVQAQAPGAGMRDPFPDALKGFAMVLVVLGHAILAVGATGAGAPGAAEMLPGAWVDRSALFNPLLSLAYAFHMPLFAFVSGLVLWRPELPAFGPRLRRRVIGLLLPYFSWFVILYALGVARGIALDPFPTTLLQAAIDVDTYGTLWFLHVLFTGSVLLLSLVHLPGSRWTVPGSALLMIALTAVPLLTTSFLGLVHLRWIYPFLVLGYLAGGVREPLAQLRVPMAVGGTVAFAGLLVLRHPTNLPVESIIGRVELALNAWGWQLGSVAEVSVAYLCALAGICATYGILLVLVHARGDGILRPGAWIGLRSLGIYAVHDLVNTALLAAGIVWWPPLFVASLGLSLAATLVLERTPVLDVALTGRRRGTCSPYPPRTGTI